MVVAKLRIEKIFQLGKTTLGFERAWTRQRFEPALLGSEGQNQKWRAQDSNHNKGRCDLTLCPDVVDVL
jgi:hypothetical protein